MSNRVAEFRVKGDFWHASMLLISVVLMALISGSIDSWDDAARLAVLSLMTVILVATWRMSRRQSKLPLEARKRLPRYFPNLQDMVFVVVGSLVLLEANPDRWWLYIPLAIGLSTIALDLPLWLRQEIATSFPSDSSGDVVERAEATSE